MRSWELRIVTQMSVLQSGSYTLYFYFHFNFNIAIVIPKSNEINHANLQVTQISVRILYRQSDVVQSNRITR